MMGVFAKTGLAALIALGATFATVSTAAADGWRFRYDGPGYGMDYGRGGHNGYERRHQRPRGGCFPGEAVEKARWNGLHRARVHDVTPRRVVVGGVRHGDFDRMVFANVRGCPIIRY